MNATRRAQAYATIATAIRSSGGSAPAASPGPASGRAARQAGSSTPTLDALATLAGLRADLDGFERSLIDLARRDGVSWAEIALALGLGSRQAAEQRRVRLESGAQHRGAAHDQGANPRIGRQRNIDNRDEITEQLRAAVADLIAHLAVAEVDPGDEPVVNLAVTTLHLATAAPTGPLCDLARFAESDLTSVASIRDALSGPLDRLREVLRVAAGQAPRASGQS